MLVSLFVGGHFFGFLGETNETLYSIAKKPEKATRTQNKELGSSLGAHKWSHLAPRFPAEEQFELLGCGVSCIDELYDLHSCIQRFRNVWFFLRLFILEIW